MEMDPYTAALHGDAGIADGPDIAPPIHVTSTYDRSDQNDLVYRRERHPTTERLEAVLGALEGGAAVMYPSGMAAVAAVLRHLRPRRIALPDDVYHGTRSLVATEAGRGTWAVAPPATLEAGDVWWVETPSNPRGLLTDIAAVVERSRVAGVVVVVDSTFATPILQRPLALGADFVVHATTKAIAGHSDAMGGVVVTAAAGVAADLDAARTRDGSIPGSLDAWLTLRGVRTLPLRVERQSASAAAVAAHLDDSGLRVWYPGMESHPGHDIALRQMSAAGSVLAFEVGAGRDPAGVLGRFELIRTATSLGGVESLAEHRTEVAAASPGLIRLSIGLESPEMLIADLARALA